MKYLASILALTLLALATVYSAPPAAPPSGGAGADTQAPGLFGYTPVPKSTPAQSADGKPSGPKQPLTASLAKDDKGKSPATAFARSETEYVVWKDPTGAKGDKVRTVWYAEDAGKALPKNKKLSEYTQTVPGPGAFGAAASPTIKGGLPPGKYRAEVYEGAKLAAKLPFTIQ